MENPKYLRFTSCGNMSTKDENRNWTKTIILLLFISIIVYLGVSLYKNYYFHSTFSYITSYFKDLKF